MAFHNRYGGYLIVGVRELEFESFQVVGAPLPLDIELLKNKLREFTGERIGITQTVLVSHDIDGHEAPLNLLYIPPRHTGDRLVHFIKDGPAKPPKNAPVFRTGDLWYRESDECRHATANKVLELNPVRKHPLLEKPSLITTTPLARIYHNLPDRSLICPEVVGRRDALEQLWEYLSDDLSHVKVLAGEGGIGKSTIAYEFADQVTLLSENPFMQVIWLSAKQSQFRPFRDTYERMPETHFSNYDELLDAICGYLAVVPDDLQYADPKKKLRLIKNALEIFPSMFIIDDIDSLHEDEQRRSFEIGPVIGGNSKLLLTTRRNVSYSKDVCCEIQGLELEEFREYFDALCSRFSISPLKAVKSGEVKEIWTASHGSPLFAEGILRLLKYDNVAMALRKWTGESGDTVRKAALQREVSHLLPEARGESY